MWIKVALSKKDEASPDGTTSRVETVLRETLQELPSAEKEGVVKGKKQSRKDSAKKPGKESIELNPILAKGNVKAEQIRVSRNVQMIVADSESALKQTRFRF